MSDNSNFYLDASDSFLYKNINFTDEELDLLYSPKNISPSNSNLEIKQQSVSLIPVEQESLNSSFKYNTAPLSDSSYYRCLVSSSSSDAPEFHSKNPKSEAKSAFSFDDYSFDDHNLSLNSIPISEPVLGISLSSPSIDKDNKLRESFQNQSFTQANCTDSENNQNVTDNQEKQNSNRFATVNNGQLLTAHINVFDKTYMHNDDPSQPYFSMHSSVEGPVAPVINSTIYSTNGNTSLFNANNGMILPSLSSRGYSNNIRNYPIMEQNEMKEQKPDLNETSYQAQASTNNFVYQNHATTVNPNNVHSTFYFGSATENSDPTARPMSISSVNSTYFDRPMSLGSIGSIGMKDRPTSLSSVGTINLNDRPMSLSSVGSFNGRPISIGSDGSHDFSVSNFSFHSQYQCVHSLRNVTNSYPLQSNQPPPHVLSQFRNNLENFEKVKANQDAIIDSENQDQSPNSSSYNSSPDVRFAQTFKTDNDSNSFLSSQNEANNRFRSKNSKPIKSLYIECEPTNQSTTMRSGQNARNSTRYESLTHDHMGVEIQGLSIKDSQDRLQSRESRHADIASYQLLQLKNSKLGVSALDPAKKVKAKKGVKVVHSKTNYADNGDGDDLEDQEGEDDSGAKRRSTNSLAEISRRFVEYYGKKDSLKNISGEFPIDNLENYKVLPNQTNGLPESFGVKIDAFQDQKKMGSVSEASEVLSVHLRRIYEVVKILEILSFITFFGQRKGRFVWLGTNYFLYTLGCMQAEAIEKNHSIARVVGLYMGGDDTDEMKKRNIIQESMIISPHRPVSTRITKSLSQDDQKNQRKSVYFFQSDDELEGSYDNDWLESKDGTNLIGDEELSPFAKKDLLRNPAGGSHRVNGRRFRQHNTDMPSPSSSTLLHQINSMAPVAGSSAVMIKTDIAKRNKQSTTPKQILISSAAAAGAAKNTLNKGRKQLSTDDMTVESICKRFLQLFLVGYDIMTMNFIIHKLIPNVEDYPYEEYNKKNATKIRRVYDVANVLCSLQLLQKRMASKQEVLFDTKNEQMNSEFEAIKYLENLKNSVTNISSTHRYDDMESDASTIASTVTSNDNTSKAGSYRTSIRVGQIRTVSEDSNSKSNRMGVLPFSAVTTSTIGNGSKTDHVKVLVWSSYPLLRIRELFVAKQNL